MYDEKSYASAMRQLFDPKDIRGKFIYVEGPDGVGKTTQLGRLEGYFKYLGYNVKKIRHPGYNTFARDMLFDKAGVKDFWSRRMVFLAEYLDFLSDLQNDSFDKETIYLIDRSILVSNPCIGGAEYDTINHTNYGATEVVKKLLPFYDKKESPDCIIVLYNDPAVSEKRLQDRAINGGESNFYDEMGMSFRRKCSINYYNLILVSKNSPELLPFYGIYNNPIVDIDATGDEVQVFNDIVAKLNEKFTINKINLG